MPLTVGTAAPSGDLVRTYARRMGVIDSRRSNLLRAFADRSHESEVMNAERVHIPNPVLPGKGSATARTRNANWRGNAGQPTQTFLTLAIDQSLEDEVELEYRDNIEAPLNYLELNRRSMAAGLNTSKEDNLFTFLNADGNYTSESSLELGTRGTDFINPTGGVENGEVGEKIVDAIFDIQAELSEKNKMGPAMGDQIDRAPRGPVCIMHPQCFKVVAKYLLNEKYSLDALTMEVLDAMSVRRREAFMGRLFGIDIYSSAVTPKPTAGNTNKWDILIFSPDAWTYAERPPVIQYLTPETNQTKPSYLLRQIEDFGRLILDKSVMFRRRVHSN